MSRNDVFLETKEFGDLYYKDTLLNYKYPVAFICKKLTNNDLFLFYEWLMTKITNDEYWNIVGRKTSLQNVYRSKSEDVLFLIRKTYGSDKDEVTVVNDRTDHLKYLPHDDVFAE